MSRISPIVSPTMATGISPRVLLLWRAYMELAKARLSGLVVVTTAVGYLLGSRGGIDLAGFGWTVIGTMLAAACANAMNQVIEVDRDAKMSRTANRPLPAGRISAVHATVMAVGAGGIGLTILAAMVNLLTAALGLVTIGLYLFVYTPLKTRSTSNTLFGAVVGAIPPMMGWAAATGEISAGAWALGAILFVWQIPHFLSLAWMYRTDYAQGGYRMLPVIDPSGTMTGRTVLMWSAALVPAGLSIALVGVSGHWYALISIALGAWLLRLAVVMYQQRTPAAARRVFLATVTYLPLLLFVMVLDASSPVEPLTSADTDRPVAHQTITIGN